MDSRKPSPAKPARRGPSRQAPLVLGAVAAGFPSPADDHVDRSLDLNEYLVPNPAATFFVRVEGESMTGAGISPGDLLVVDRSREPADGKIVVAVLDGEMTVKRLRKKGRRVELVPENRSFEPPPISVETDFRVWGVVTAVIRRL